MQTFIVNYQMGCDFYIIKMLQIHCDHNMLEIELDRNKGYYGEFDDDEFESDEKYKDFMLTPQTKPVVVFEDNQFIKSHFEQKYKRKIEDKLNECGKQWCDIVKVVKFEERFERD